MNQPTLFSTEPDPPAADSWPPLKRFILAWFPCEHGEHKEATPVQLASFIARQREDKKRTTPDGLNLDIFQTIGNLVGSEYLNDSGGWLSITDKGLVALGGTI